MKHDDSVTIAKAIGIMLMVLAHSGFSKVGNTAINMFHMPLFFFMSGYCFKELYLNSPKQWLQGKTRKLYWPYVKYSLLFLLLHNAFYSLHIYSKYYSTQDFLFRIPRIIIAMGMHDQLLGGFWFLGALFWGLIIAYVFLKLFRNNAVYGIILSLIVSMVMNGTDFHIPIIVVRHHHFFSAAFILAGIQYKRKGLNIENSRLVIIPLGMAFVLVGTFFWPADVTKIDIWKTIPYYITALCGTLMVFAIAKIIVNKWYCVLLKKIGGGTLEILTWHFLSFKSVTFLIIIVYGLPIESLSKFPVIREYSSHGWWLAYFVVGILFPICIKHIISLIEYKIKGLKQI